MKRTEPSATQQPRSQRRSTAHTPPLKFEHNKAPKSGRLKPKTRAQRPNKRAPRNKHDQTNEHRQTTKHPNDQTNEHRQTTKTKQTSTHKQPRPNKRAPTNDQTNEHRQTTNAQTNEHPKSLRHFSSSLASVDNSDRRRACEGNVLKACSDTPLLQGSLLDRRLHHVRIQNDPHISQSSQRLWAPWMHNGPALLLIAKFTRKRMALTNKQQTINNPRYLQSGRAAEA
jgi:hypothetical protein